MVDLHLARTVYFCESGDGRIFLDLAADRYFRLPAEADQSFAALIAGPKGDDPGVEALLAAGLLERAPAGKPIAPTRHPLPERSLVEEESAARIRLGLLPEVLLHSLWAKRAVAQERLPRLLAPGQAASARRACPHRRDQAALAFLDARRLIPIAPNCLRDSLALRRFLDRRSIRADLVIGARLDPFGAHCWLQDGGLILNDSLASARGFTPILVA